MIIVIISRYLPVLSGANEDPRLKRVPWLLAERLSLKKLKLNLIVANFIQKKINT